MKTLQRFFSMLCSCAALLLVFAPAYADNATPLVKVEAIYAYLTGNDPMRPTDLEMLRQIAAPSLRTLLEREEACLKKGGQKCKYDFSVIVDGDDYKLSDLTFAEKQPSANLTEITASFSNFYVPSMVIYHFARENGEWLLTDVRGGAVDSWSLVEMLQ